MVLEDSQWEGSTPPVVLQLYWAGEIPEKLVENTDSRLPPPGVWFGGDVTKTQKQNNNKNIHIFNKNLS